MNQQSQNNDFSRRAFEFCLAIYRLTNFFPAGEPLKNQLREISGDIAAFLAVGPDCDIISKIEKIKIYLAIAKTQNWLKPVNFDLLIKAYTGLTQDLIAFQKVQEKQPSVKRKSEKKIIDTPLPESRSAEPKPEEKSESIFRSFEARGRQKKIVDCLKKKGPLPSPEIRKFLGKKISERTLRNDLEDLINTGQIKKIGSNKGAYYILAE